MKEYVIVDDSGNLLISLSWFNEKTEDIIFPKMERYIYENVIYLLLLIREVSTTDSNTRSEKASFIEENIVFLERAVLTKISGYFSLDTGKIAAIGEILINSRDSWKEVDWDSLGLKADHALRSTGFSDLKSDEFESRFLNDDFRF